VEACSRNASGQPSVPAGGLGESASGLSNRCKDADVNSLGFGVTQQRAGDMAEAVWVQIRQTAEILHMSARI